MKSAVTKREQDEDEAYENARQQLIDAEGFYNDMPMAEYLADPCERPSLNSSTLGKLINRSPLHAWTGHPRLNPRYRSHESDAFDYGTAAHALFLEGTEDGLVIVEADDWRTKAAREAKQAAHAAGKTPLLTRQVAQVRTMVEASRQALQASELAGIEWTNELTMIWHEGDAPCRARMDSLSADTRIILDYKTTENANPDAFSRSLFSYGYDLQAAFYLRGLEALGHEGAQFVFLAQETEPPFACSLIGLDPACLAIAQERVRYGIELWKRCVRSGDWPGYPNRVAWLEPPAWYASQARSWEEMMELGGQA